MRNPTPVLILLLAAMLAGCPQGQTTDTTVTTVEPDSNSGGDESPSGARGLSDIVVNDSIDAPGGDNTDYKYVDVDEEGTVDIRVLFSAASVAGSVGIYNGYNELLREQSFAAGATEVVVEGFDVIPGRYYVRLSANQGTSDYAIGRTFTPSGPSDADLAWRQEQLDLARQAAMEGDFDRAREILEEILVRFPNDEEVELELAFLRIDEAIADHDFDEARRLLDDLRPDYNDSRSLLSRIDDKAEEIDDDEEDYESSRRRRRRTETTETTTTTTTTETTTTPVETTTTTTETTTTPVETTTTTTETEEASVRASIITIRDAGAGTTLVLTGCGTSSGLTEGTSGRISGTSHRATITRITGGNSCEAESSATAGEIGNASGVSFSP